ncbi:FAD-dependent monooxygenase [Dactylosporangium vinaceum]|uniref:FAD-dependent monooxygenase n=1 Tax=Dactylosporangium vinaceum TaxID=53362 RepID=A0ABV5M3C1_9ACTN|nr:FAD-dependent monooxygenase [Dactylosporangium vinaceum]UAB99748.1 FAD-dependent monooxygenase [Dactylosporangium vinaceum]
MKHFDADVIVAGAGPVGLMLAIELRTAGIDVMLLERRAEADPVTKAGSIGPLAVEALERRGLMPQLLAAEERTLQGYADMAAAGGYSGEAHGPKEHFAGLDKIDSSRYGAGRRRMRVEQPVLVGILQEALGRLGGNLRRDHEATGVEQDTDGVTVTACTRGGERSLRARFLVGCDGGGSAVRALAAIAFTGTPATLTGRRAVVTLDDPAALRPGFAYTPGGVLVYGLGVNRVATLEFDGPPPADSGPMTLEDLRASLARVRGTDVPITAMDGGGYFADGAYQAATYRSGRVLLAGDAAHVHAPFGGQGLNVGLVDAVNLGWKLAAAIRGWAPAGLLDTYSAERQPVGARLVDNTRAQTALMRPDPHSTALRNLFAELMDLPEVERHLGRMLAGFDTRYNVGGNDPLAGTILPNLTLRAAGGGLVAQAAFAEAGHGLLLDMVPAYGLAEVAQPWAGRIDVIRASAIVGGQLPGLTAVLLRPDNCVLWAARPGDEPDRAGLTEVLRTWFGD